MWDKVWTFKTARFEIGLEFGPDHDFSHMRCYDRTTREGLERGTLFAFTARVYVRLDGATIGEDYLGGCVYASERDFMRDGYFRDMVRCAIAEARAHIANVPILRAA